MPLDGARRTMLYFWDMVAALAGACCMLVFVACMFLRDTALTLTYAALLGASRFYDRLFPSPPKGGWIYSPAPPICGFRGPKKEN